MATQFSVLAWRIPWTEDPAGLQSISHKESDTSERLSNHTHSLQGQMLKLKLQSFAHLV